MMPSVKEVNDFAIRLMDTLASRLAIAHGQWAPAGEWPRLDPCTLID